jgi:hypothetical protein
VALCVGRRNRTVSTSGEVEALVEQVHGEQDAHRAAAQRRQGGLAFRGRGVAAHGERGDAGVTEDPCHVGGVGDGDAEAQGPHPAGVGDLVADLAQHDPGAGVVAGVDAVEAGDVVGPALPLDPGQVGAVGDAEVVERAEQVGVEGVPESELGSGPAAEEGPDVDAVAALGGGGEPEQLAGLEAVQQPAVGRGLGVVELVDDDDVEGGGVEVVHAVCRERLHAGEHVAPALRPGPADPHLAEGGVAQDLAVGAQRLGEDLRAVGDEEQGRAGACRRWELLREPPVVQRRDDRLAGPRGRDDEVAVAVVDLPLHVQGLEHRRLVRVGADLEAGEVHRRRRVLGAPARLREGVVEAVGVAVGVVGLEGLVRPVGVERRRELRQQRRRGDRGEADVPLEPLEQRRPGQVRRADVGGVVAGGAAEQPRLGVEPGRQALVADLHGGAVAPHQLVQCPSLGGPHIRRGDHAERHPAFGHLGELGLEQPQAVELHEGAEQVDARGARQLRAQLGGQGGLVAGVGQQGGVGEGGLRAQGVDTGRGGLDQGQQPGRAGLHGGVGSRHRGEQPVRHGDALVGGHLGERPAHDVADVACHELGHQVCLDGAGDGVQLGPGSECAGETGGQQGVVETLGQVRMVLAGRHPPELARGAGRRGAAAAAGRWIAIEQRLVAEAGREVRFG